MGDHHQQSRIHNNASRSPKVTDWESADGTLRGVVIVLEPFLSAFDVANVWELIDAGEWGLAHDTLCTQLYEFDVHVDEDVYATLEALGTYYALEPSMWQVLRAAE